MEDEEYVRLYDEEFEVRSANVSKEALAMMARLEKGKVTTRFTPYGKLAYKIKKKELRKEQVYLKVGGDA